MSDVKLEFLTLADFAMNSAEGKLSIIGMFDRMFVADTPSKFLRFFIVAIISGQQDSEVKVSYIVQSPTKKEALNPKEVMVRIGSGGKANLIVDVANFPLPEIGKYNVMLKANGKTIGSTVFFVSKVSSTSNASSKVVN